MSNTTKKVATLCAALMGLSGVLAACDNDGGDPHEHDDAGVDAGPRDSGTDAGMEVDAGQDASMENDAGQDAGPPPANLRLAHLIPNVPGDPDMGQTGLIHLCLAPATAPDTQLLITRDADGRPRPIPYGGVSDYTNRLPLLPITYRVYVYERADVPGMTCPETSEALFHTDVDASRLMGGEYYTIAAVGLIGGSGPHEPDLVVVHDVRMEPADGMTRVRFVNGLANVPGRANIDVCYDPDFSFSPAGAPEPGPMPGELVQGDLQFLGEVAEIEVPYVERAPIGSGAGPAGYLFVYARGASATDCASPASMPIQAIPIPIPVPPPDTPGIPPNITATIDAGDQVSIFLRGDVAFATTVLPLPCDPSVPASCSGAGSGAVCHPVARRCVHPLAPTLTPWIDDL
jgi:hypothetical protein